MIDSLHLREYEPGDEVAIVRGMERAFAPVDAGFRAPSPAAWRWRWLANPAGARVTLAVDEAGEVRAQYAAQGREVLVGGARVAASHAADSFVDPGLRGLGRRGLFVRTGERFAATFGGAEGARDRWMYGWPAPAAARIGARALGYRGVRADVLLVRAAEAPAPAVAPAARAHAVGPEHDALCAERAGAYAALGVRDAAWLRWRYLDAPEADYALLEARADGALAGYAVGRALRLFGRERFVLVDWLARPEARAALVAGAVAAAQGRELALLLPPWCDDFAALQELGFRVEPAPLWLVGRSYDRRLPHALWRAGWYYTLGDGDLA